MILAPDHARQHNQQAEGKHNPHPAGYRRDIHASGDATVPCIHAEKKESPTFLTFDF